MSRKRVSAEDRKVIVTVKQSTVNSAVNAGYFIVNKKGNRVPDIDAYLGFLFKNITDGALIELKAKLVQFP